MRACCSVFAAVSDHKLCVEHEEYDTESGTHSAVLELMAAVILQLSNLGRLKECAQNHSR